MKTELGVNRSTARWLANKLLLLSLAAVLGSCGGGGDSAPAYYGDRYRASALVSDGTIAAAHIDPFLLNGWGIAFNPQGVAWVAANGSSTSTLYDGNGVPQSLVVAMPAGQAGAAGPTGIVYNPTADFLITQGGVVAKSVFIFVGEAGTVSAWAPSVNATNAVTTYDGGAVGKAYKGAALSNYLGTNYLYVTDFQHGLVDVFDPNFNRVIVPGNFADPSIPADYAPYGIQAIGNLIYVSYAKRTIQGFDEVIGPGLGFVNVFDSGGYLVRELLTAERLNAPWGMALAPSNFGIFSNALLVGNFGDGRINAYDPVSGAYLGTLANEVGAAISIDGLRGISFGNGFNSQPTNTLFFAAGPGGQVHGLVGRIDLE
ncbi:MAG: TIGR03118 family protein [Pseudomonadota bacterium]